MLVAAVLAVLLLVWPALPSDATARPGPVRVEAPVAAGDLTADDVTAWLDGYLPARMEAAGITGGAVSVVDDGQVIASRGYGTTSAGGGEQVDPDRTLFRTGSVSKLVTATAAMQLVQDGRLDLDADVSEQLDFDLPLAFDEPLTLRHLLTHTGGFEERVSPFIDEDEVTPLREFVAEDPPEQVYAPGTVPAYSNYGMSLVGYLVERASGQPYDDYVQQQVLDPLDMGRSTVAQPPPGDLAGGVSAGYSDGGRTEVPFELIAAAPAGAFSASAGDMAHFMLAHLSGGSYGGSELLDPATTELMHAPGLGEAELGQLAGGERMALGFFREDRNGHRVLGHGGDTTAFHTHLQIYPDDGAGIFVALNSSGSPASVTAGLRQQLVDGFADRYFPETRPASAAPAALATSAEHARAAEGTYTMSRSLTSTLLRVLDVPTAATVTAGAGGTLEVSTLRAPDGTPKQWREVEPWVWKDATGQDTIAMRTDGDRVTAIGHDAAFTLLRAGPSAALALPVLIGSAVVLALTALAWPAASLTRRRFGRRLQRGTAARRAHLASRTGAVLVLLVLGGWAALVAAVVVQSVDPPQLVVRFLQVLGVMGLTALLAGAGSHALLAQRHREWWGGRVWSLVLLVAAVGAAWFSAGYGLLSPSATF